MLNHAMNRRFTACMLTICWFVTLTACVFEPTLPEATIWTGYVLVASGGAVSDMELAEAVTDAQATYRIWRLGSGSITTQPYANSNSFCLPVELMGTAEHQHGMIVSIRMVALHDNDVMVPLTFVRWEGVDAWFVTEVGNPTVCYRIE